ncbi:hypothetical protein [uncultured Clostridium sp.]|nr:hypothetical protein [uncultured Clostridium sp.]
MGDYSIKGYVGQNGINIMQYYIELAFISAMSNAIAKGIKEGIR